MPHQLPLFATEPPHRGVSIDRGDTAAIVNVFLAIFPDADTANWIAELCEALAARLGLKGKPRKPEILHNSLLGLGWRHELSGDDIERVKSLAAKLPRRAFPVVFDRIASFGVAEQSKALVLRERGGNDPLKAFHHQLRIVFRSTPWPVRSQFVPHMTFMYGQGFAGEHLIEPIQWRAAEFALIASYVGEQRYERLASWPLLDNAE